MPHTPAQDPPRDLGAGPPPPTITSTVNTAGNAAWIRVAGELDLASAPRLARALDVTGPQLLTVLDLRRLTFLDCAAVHVVVDAGARARAADRRLLVLHGPPAVDRTFTLTGAVDDVEWFRPASAC